MNSNTIMTLMPLILLIVVMYFLLIRPQKKKEKEVNAMRNGIRVGDEIITIGGICAKVVKTKDDSLIIQVGADKVKFEVMRWSVSKVLSKGEMPSRPTDEEAPFKSSKPKKLSKKAAAPAEEPAPAEEAAPVEEAAPAEEKAE